MKRQDRSAEVFKRKAVLGLVAGFLVSSGLVLLDPSAPAALATVTVPDPVAWPSSTLSAVASNPYKTLGNAVAPSTLTANQWHSTLTANPRALPTAVTSTGWGGKLGVIGRGAGQVGMAVLAFDLGYGVGSAGMNMIGVESNGVYCDISNLFGGSFGCALGASPEYVANLDVEGVTPGWQGVPVASTSAVKWQRDAYSPWTDGPVAVTVRYEVEVTPDGQTIVHWLPSVGGEQYRYPSTRSPATAWTVPTFWVYSTANGSGQWTNNTAYTGWRPNQSLNVTFGVRTIEFIVVGTSQIVGSSSPPMTPDGASSTVATWYRPGHPERPPYLGENPVRTWVTTYECADGRSGTITSEAWREADPEWPAIPQAPCMAGVLRLTVDQVTEGLPPVRVVDWEAPAPLIDTVTDYPQCVDGSCQLILERIDEVTGRPLSCFANPSLCAGWWPEFQADPDAAAEKYRCTYAGAPVPLDECKVYAPTFDTGDYGDPETGDPPVPGPNPDPTPGPEADPSCPPPFTWTSLVNPWWYYKSAVCAIQDAFVPKNSDANIKRIKDAFGRTAPALFMGEVANMWDGLNPGEADCKGPGMRWERMNMDIYPFNACDPPMDNVALWSYRLSSVALVIFGSMACVRAVGSGLGWKPSAGGDL